MAGSTKWVVAGAMAALSATLGAGAAYAAQAGGEQGTAVVASGTVGYYYPPAITEIYGDGPMEWEWWPAW